MLVFFCLLTTATWASVYREWDDWADCPARCIPKDRQNLGGEPLAWAIATTYFLVTQYSAYAMQLGEKIMGRATFLRKKAHNADKGITTRLRKRHTLFDIYKLLRFAVLTWRFYNWSEVCELLQMMAWFSVNCYWVRGNREAGEEVFGNTIAGEKERSKEDECGFGQIVPLVLLSRFFYSNIRLSLNDSLLARSVSHHDFCQHLSR